MTGVSIQPRDFGGKERRNKNALFFFFFFFSYTFLFVLSLGIGGVDFLDHTDDPLHLTAVYQQIIEALLGIGYEPGVTLFGAPYDW
jgi:hypothetical protein